MLTLDIKGAFDAVLPDRMHHSAAMGPRLANVVQWHLSVYLMIRSEIWVDTCAVAAVME